MNCNPLVVGTRYRATWSISMRPQVPHHKDRSLHGAVEIVSNIVSSRGDKNVPILLTILELTVAILKYLRIPDIRLKEMDSCI